jgi:hypothetical protein
MSDRQIPGQSFTFKCGHQAMLPATKGEGNNAAYWRKSRTEMSSNWGCRPCNVQLLREVRNTPIGWARTILWQAKANAKKYGIARPNITVEDFIELAQTTTHCSACGHQLPALTYRKKKCSERRQLHHNHETGEVIGFVHNHCNMAEGYLSRIPSVEGKRQFMKVLFPEV